jgi:hypothetical protein
MQSTNQHTEKTQSQFSLRTLLVVTMVVAIIVSVAQLLVRDPITIIVTFVCSFALALVGFTFLVGASLLALAISSSSNDGNRRNNLNRCLQLSLIGLIAFAPLAICFVMLRLL